MLSNNKSSTVDILAILIETEKAIKQLASGKAPGSDSGEPKLQQTLYELFEKMWEAEKLPQEFKDTNIVHLYKRKGNIKDCDNYKGISLMYIAGKILSRILLNRLIQHLETVPAPESQCGFKKNHGTIDMNFAVKQLQEKCQEQNMAFYTVFTDLTKGKLTNIH